MRILTGPGADAVLAASGAILLVGASRSPRLAIGWLALAALAVLQVVAPRFQWPDALSPAAWYAPASPLSRWSIAPWETLRWAMLFCGAACWMPLLSGGRRRRRDVGRALRALGVVTAGAVLAGRLTGRDLVQGGENHIAIFLTMTAAEPIRRLRQAEVTPWLSVLLIGAAVGATGAILPLILLVGLVLWSVRAPARLSFDMTPARQVAFIGSALLVAVLIAGASGRWPVWRDGLAMAADTLPLGSGFGTFHWGFPAWAVHLPAPAGRALHPESTLLWWLIEGGIPGVLLLWCFRARPASGRAAQAARWALALLALESLIEVPLLWSPCFWLAVACHAIGFEHRTQAVA